jgi:CTP synthase (UTP-ammonia lyase)
MIVPGTVAAQAMGPGASTERYFCRYGLSPEFVGNLVAGGLVMSGHDERGDVRVAELPGHPFFVGSLFQPELSSDRSWLHPLITAFASAVRQRAAAAETVG